MFDYPQVLDNQESPDSTVGRMVKRRFLSESGVYAKLALAIESFGKTGWDDEKDDDQEAITLVRVPVLPASTPVNADLADDLRGEELTAAHADLLDEAILIEAKSVVENEPVCAQSSSALPQADCLQVTLHLRGEELAWLWAHEAAALAGRAYVWSQRSHSWQMIEDDPEALRAIGQPALAPAKHTDAVLAPVGQRSQTLALTRYAALTNVGFVALGAAAALSIILCLSRLIPYASAPGVDTKLNQPAPALGVHEANDSRRAAAVVGNSVASTTSATRIESREIIPVTALPLVGKRGASRSRTHG